MKQLCIVVIFVLACVFNCMDLLAYTDKESTPNFGNFPIDPPNKLTMKPIDKNEAQKFGSFPSIDALETIGERATYNASVRNFDVARYEKVLGKGNVNMNLPAEVLEAQCRQVQQARQEQTALCVLIAIGIFLGLIIVVSSCSHKVTFVAVENSEILEGNENLE